MLQTGLAHYKRLSVMLARRSGAWFKNTLFVAAARAAGSRDSIPQKACSALLHGFESRNRDWEPKIRIFVYNAEAVMLQIYILDFNKIYD